MALVGHLWPHVKRFDGPGSSAARPRASYGGRKFGAAGMIERAGAGRHRDRRGRARRAGTGRGASVVRAPQGASRSNLRRREAAALRRGAAEAWARERRLSCGLLSATRGPASAQGAAPMRRSASLPPSSPKWAGRDRLTHLCGRPEVYDRQMDRRTTYLEHAEEVEALARRMDFEPDREAMLAIATEWRRLAAQAEPVREN